MRRAAGDLRGGCTTTTASSDRPPRQPRMTRGPQPGRATIRKTEEKEKSEPAPTSFASASELGNSGSAASPQHPNWLRLNLTRGHAAIAVFGAEVHPRGVV
jgi:hypothetical protein